jgi:protein-tyrosine phosphatase
MKINLKSENILQMSHIIDNLFLSSISEMYNKVETKNTKLHINAQQDKIFPEFDNIQTQINLNWRDSPLQNINEHGILFNIIRLMDSYISEGKQVLVNCYAGVSRSATIVIGYLMYKNKMNVQDALSFVRQKRPIINPNYGFVCQLYNLQEELHKLDNVSTYKSKTTEDVEKEVLYTYNQVPFIKEILKCENYLRDLV